MRTQYTHDTRRAQLAEKRDEGENFTLSAISYLKTTRVTIQCNAVILIGFLVGNQVAQQRFAMQDKAIAALLPLLSSNVGEVRVRAAESLCMCAT